MMGTAQRVIPTFAGGILRIGPLSVSYERIVTFSIAILVLVVITWLLGRSAWGQKMQAIAQNMEGALLQGINVHKTSAIACALGCVLAALAGCLMAAYSRLGPFVGDFILQKVLMVVILSGVGSLGGIFIAGMILGSMDAVLSMLLRGSVSDAISVTILILLLLYRPKGFFGHEVEMATGSQPTESQLSTVPETGRRKWVGITVCVTLVVVVALLPVLVDSPYIEHIIVLAFIYIIASVSLRTITLSGQFPLAHGAFMGIGAYLSAIISTWLGWSPWATMPLAALITMGLGILIGIPFARLRSLYYAMGSLFFGIGVIQVILAGGTLTGSYDGLAGIPGLFTSSQFPYYYLFLGLALISIIVLYRFEFSRIGTILKAIAQSHQVASSVGIDEGFYRILAVGVGCFFVGLAGAGYAHYNLVLSPTSFDLSATLWLFMYVLIGGINGFAGPIIGTAILVLIPEFLRGLKMYSPYISACILLIVVYLMPGGLASLPQLLRVRSAHSKS
jgi:branched-chain amino acid transport system permease protein